MSGKCFCHDLLSNLKKLHALPLLAFGMPRYSNNLKKKKACKWYPK